MTNTENPLAGINFSNFINTEQGASRSHITDPPTLNPEIGRWEWTEQREGMTMDPNEALRVARAECAHADEMDGLDASQLAGFVARWIEHAMAALDAYASLDAWISQGGFPPVAWEKDE